MDAGQAQHTDGYKVVRTRWVVCNKGDEANIDIRARLVATEVNDAKSDEYFASTPPLEAKRMMLSEYATARVDKFGKDLQVSFVDIRKAYFNATPKRNVHLVFPKELGMAKGRIAKLLRCVYGTRDAGQLWESCYAERLISMGF